MAAAKVRGPEQLLNEELQDIYDAEKQLVRALPKMAKAASDEGLRNALREHLEVTRAHVERIKQLFESMEMRARSRSCKGMRGIVEEGQDLIAEDREAALTDAAIIAAGRRVEHYEMAAYENLRDMVRQMGNKEAAGIIEETLREEIEADKQLAQLGKRLFKEAARPRVEETEGRRPRKIAKKASGGTKLQRKSSVRSKGEVSGRGGHAVSRILTHPDEIREWAEERGARPAHVKGTGGGEDVGMIRLDFPGYSGEYTLEPIGWDKWFQKFDERGLALVVEDETASGQKSNFNKLVSHETVRGRTRSAH
jgi:ferritin-like metal-binding protein YciE